MNLGYTVGRTGGGGGVEVNKQKKQPNLIELPRQHFLMYNLI